MYDLMDSIIVTFLGVNANAYLLDLWLVTAGASASLLPRLEARRKDSARATMSFSGGVTVMMTAGIFFWPTEIQS